VGGLRGESDLLGTNLAAEGAKVIAVSNVEEVDVLLV
jgi:hypothetical protein